MEISLKSLQRICDELRILLTSSITVEASQDKQFRGYVRGYRRALGDVLAKAFDQDREQGIRSGGVQEFCQKERSDVFTRPDQGSPERTAAYAKGYRAALDAVLTFLDVHPKGTTIRLTRSQTFRLPFAYTHGSEVE